MAAAAAGERLNNKGGSATAVCRKVFTTPGSGRGKSSQAALLVSMSNGESKDSNYEILHDLTFWCLQLASSRQLASALAQKWVAYNTTPDVNEGHDHKRGLTLRALSFVYNPDTRVLTRTRKSGSCSSCNGLPGCFRFACSRWH